MPSGIGERIKDIRFDLKLNQEEFGKVMNSSQRKISRYETEETPPDIEFITSLIELYKVNPLWLLTGRGQMYLYSQDETSLFNSLHEDQTLLNIMKVIKKDPHIKIVLLALLIDAHDDTEIERQLNILRASLKK